MAKKRSYGKDYSSWFILGIILFPIGIALQNTALWIIGLVFMAVGASNEKKWKKNHCAWNDLTKKQRRIKIITLILVFLVAVAFGIYFVLRY